MLTYDEIKEYWNKRAAENRSSPHATTDDFYMREIEANAIIRTLNRFSSIEKIGDIGCGDGLCTIKASLKYTDKLFCGFDYSDKMIENAEENKQQLQCKNVSFSVHDITEKKLDQKFDMIFTTRCLININSTELQLASIKNIYESLTPNGIYLMIENFVDGQNHFNELRKQFQLPEIHIREHNLFFEHHSLINNIKGMFSLLEIENISSLYYIVSRIIYSKICQNNTQTPNYYDIHHELGSKLPFLGNFGPIKMLILQKNE